MGGLGCCCGAQTSGECPHPGSAGNWEQHTGRGKLAMAVVSSDALSHCLVLQANQVLKGFRTVSQRLVSSWLGSWLTCMCVTVTVELEWTVIVSHYYSRCWWAVAVWCRYNFPHSTGDWPGTSWLSPVSSDPWRRESYTVSAHTSSTEEPSYNTRVSSSN